MATDGLPALATWAEVDPVRYPFDPDEVPTVMPPLVTDDRLGWITDRIPSRAEVPVAGTLDERFDDWPPPTTAVVDEVAERLARDAFGLPMIART